MGKLKKVCAAIGGAAIISAAIMGAVSASTAGLDAIDKSFIYDPNNRPHVQIVVGEKASAADVVGAGNIAATIGNLAYTTGACAANETAGEVKLAVKSWRLIGKYEQDVRGRQIGLIDLEGSFLGDKPYGSFFAPEGQMLANGTLSYRPGMFKDYELGCQIGRRVADFPMRDKFCNELCTLCYDICMETEPPEHEMEESISVDGTKVRYYVDGLGCDAKAESLKMKVECGALQYKVALDGIPTRDILRGGKMIDTSYRGKMLFMGSKDYYVSSLRGGPTPRIILAKGEKLHINPVGYTETTLPEIKGYKFRLVRAIQAAGVDAGIVMSVERPDGTTVDATATKFRGAVLHDAHLKRTIEIQAFEVIGHEATIIVYDKTTELKLEHDRKIDGWRVKIDFRKCHEAGIRVYADPDVLSPRGNADRVDCLMNLTLTQEDVKTLSVGEMIFFPTKAVKFSFEGFKDEDFGDPVCSGGEDKIKIETKDNRKVLLSFTTRDGERLNNVRLDEGGYGEGELFLIGNTVYQFRGIERVRDTVDFIDLLLTDITNANNFKVRLTRFTNFTGFNYTYFDRYSGRLEDSCMYPCYSYRGTLPVLGLEGIVAYFHHNKLWMDRVNDGRIGLHVINLRDFEGDECPAWLWTVFENTTDINEIGLPNNTDDELLVFKGCGEDETIIDFYDRGREGRSPKGDYRTSVRITGLEFVERTENRTNVSLYVCYNYTLLGFPERGELRCREDTKIWSPRGGDVFTVTDYGADKQIKAVEICHPTKRPYITYFVGKERKEAEHIGIITAGDVGKTKRIGCCEFTVRAFGLAANVTNVTGCINVQPVGTLVVLDKDAGVGNLIAVGGPAVNTVTAKAGVTKEEIAAAPDKYIIKLVNRTLVVAGWEAEDTNEAANKVIEWLLANIHR